MFAVVRIKGSVSVAREIKDTLDMLRLKRVNHCVLLPENETFKGMIQKGKDCITWGEITQDSLEKLIFKRGCLDGKPIDKQKAEELAKKIFSSDKGIKDSGLKPVFRLSPPSKGYIAVRRFFPKGSLGYRGDKINELLKRML